MAVKLSFTFEEVKNAVDNSTSIKEFLIFLGMNVNNGNYRKAEQICLDHGLEIPKHNRSTNGDSLRNFNKLPDSVYFSKGVLRSGPNTKKRLIKDHGWKDICSECGQEPFWNGKPLTLHLDHIDGDRFNNVIENLRILCGHCHQQTETYSNNRAVKTYTYCECGVRIHKNSNRCNKCENQNRIGINKIDYPEISYIVETIISYGSWSAAERVLGINQNSLRKYLDRNGIDPKSIKYGKKLN